VLLAQSFGNNDFQRQYCGGSLITPFEVLTAADCADFVGVPGGIPLSDLRVVVGRTNLDTCQGDSGGPLFFKAAGPGYIQAGTGWAPARPHW
jgi:secreted trypsin-like serine protease